MNNATRGLVSSAVAAVCGLGSPLIAQCGDYDGDGRDDLPACTPNEDIDGLISAGAVNVIYGGGNGLKPAGDQFFSKGTPGIASSLEASSQFANCVASGDFNGDGFDDAAVGAPYATVNGLGDSGTVSVIYGSDDGLTTHGDQLWHRGVAGVRGAVTAEQAFGFALAVGDFDGDGFDDLAIGAIRETINGFEGAGSVHVLYGSDDGLTAVGDQLFTQETQGIADAAEEDEFFGLALDSGDFDDDGRDDLAIGVPGENVGAINNAGAVAVLYGTSSGLSTSGDDLWSQDSPGIMDTAEIGDNVGWSVAAGDFDGDGIDDLAMAVEGEDVIGVTNAGAVTVLFGSGGGLTAVGDQFLHQDTDGVNDESEEFDGLGWWMNSGDFDGDGRDDIALGLPFENVDGLDNAGAVCVLYGGAQGLTASGDDFIHQDAPGITGAALATERFGAVLYVGDFDGDGRDDLGVCARNEMVNGANGAGSITVLYGRGSGLSAIGEQVWTQDSAGIRDVAELNDSFGLMAPNYYFAF